LDLGSTKASHPALAELSEAQRHQAMARFAVLQPHLENGVPLTRAAAQADIPIRTARRWLARYRAGGLASLAQPERADRGERRMPKELVTFIEGLFLRRPAPSIATVHRMACDLAGKKGWPGPAYTTVYTIARALDPALVALAQAGDRAYKEAFDLIYRRQAGRPNEMWQADHTELDMLVVDPPGRPARPWLTVILDDHSRAVPGYALNFTAPSALQTALALHQAIWRKADPAWQVCGIPETLYSDHGTDFTSRHMDQVCADLHIQLVHSTAGSPQGRGKIERFFSTVNQLLLPTLPGQLVNGKLATPPKLTLAQLDEILQAFIVGDYHFRPHGETKQPPRERWEAGGFLPRMPDSLEQLDLLLLTVATPRVVHRDGIRFQGLRYLDLTLAGYVGEAVTIRYDPRDLAEVRVFHEGQFVCRAICHELAAATISLKELQSARNRRRRELRGQIADRRSVVEELLAERKPVPAPAPPRPGPRLRRYRNE
jgi:putative transposase